LRNQLPVSLDFIVPVRLEHLREEAMVTDQADMRKVSKLKRYALIVVLIYMKLTAAMDDLVHILIVWIRQIENNAKEKLQNYQLEQAEKTNGFILLLYKMLLAIENNDTPQTQMDEIEKQFEPFFPRFRPDL
jgi:hypothetical protein